MADLNAGERLGVYEIVGLLGRGGMGTVDRATRYTAQSVCTLYDVGATSLGSSTTTSPPTVSPS